MHKVMLFRARCPFLPSFILVVSHKIRCSDPDYEWLYSCRYRAIFLTSEPICARRITTEALAIIASKSLFRWRHLARQAKTRSMQSSGCAPEGVPHSQ